MSAIRYFVRKITKNTTCDIMVCIDGLSICSSYLYGWQRFELVCGSTGHCKYKPR